jgi:hypothetical protein
MIDSRRILLTESEWASSPLSIARWLGAARLNGRVYKLDRKYMVLIRDDYSRFLRPLGLNVMMKADKRYGTGRKSLKIIQRLYYIITKQKQCI